MVKLVLIGVLVFLVWAFLFARRGWSERLGGRLARAVRALRDPGAGRAAPSGEDERPAPGQLQDLSRCPTCGDWTAGPCTRTGCTSAAGDRSTPTGSP